MNLWLRQFSRAPKPCKALACIRFQPEGRVLGQWAISRCWGTDGSYPKRCSPAEPGSHPFVIKISKGLLQGRTQHPQWLKILGENIMESQGYFIWNVLRIVNLEMLPRNLVLLQLIHRAWRSILLWKMYSMLLYTSAVPPSLKPCLPRGPIPKISKYFPTLRWQP